MNILGEMSIAEWNKMRCETALKLLALFYFTDFFTTFLLIEFGGWEEANPIMNYVIQTAGTTWALLGAKIFFFGYMLVFYILNAEFRAGLQTPTMIWVLRGLVMLYAGVVVFSVYHVTQIPIS
jgi:uncharacterized membrane protein